ncbi:hypothetical protein P4S73_03440 [Paraglaciecola sp. Hal342]
MTVTFADDGQYTFVFDASDKAAPTLSIFDAQMFGENTVFIRGAMNGWGKSMRWFSMQMAVIRWILLLTRVAMNSR